MRKKFTMLFAALLACVGVAKAQITSVDELSNDKVYTIVPKEIARGAVYATSTSTYLDACGGTMDRAANKDVKIDSTSPDQQFAFYKHEGSLYLYSVGAGKFVSDVTSNLFPLAEKPGHPIAIANSSEAGYFIVKAKGTEFINVSTGWSAGCVGGWNDEDDGNKLQITAVSEMPEATLQQLTEAFNKQVELTYVYKYGETIWGKEIVTATKGEAYPTTTIFGVTLAYPTGNVPDNATNRTEVTISCTISDDMPIQFAADYENIEHWYYMNIHTAGYYLGYEDGQTSIPLNKTSVPEDSKDAYTWAFVGNPITGYQIVNYVAGEGKILSSTTYTFDGNTGANTYPLMTATPVPDTHNTYWIPTSSTYRENGFYLEQKDANKGNNKMNKRDNNLAYWNGGADGGSTFVVIERDFTGATELKAFVDETKALIEAWGDCTAVGSATIASRDAVNTAIANAEIAVENKQNCGEAQTALQSALDAVKINLPTVGKYYVLRCNHQDRYIYANSDNKMWYWNKANYNGNTSRAVWQFEAGSTEGTCKMKSAHNGSYLTSISNGVDIVFAAEGADVTISRSPYAAGAVVFTAGEEGIGIHANQNPVIGWENGAGANHFFFEEVESFSHQLNIDEYKYMTLCLNYAVTIPTGVKAYAVTDVEGQELVMKEITSVIPAGEAVIIEAETAGDYTFTYTAETGTKPANNLMKGSFYDKYVTPEGTPYVMTLNASNELVMGMAKVKDDGTIKNRSNKAYLDLPVENAAAMYSFGRGEGTTNIEAVKPVVDNVVIYDLTGRRVEKMEKGIYIVNGKKVVIR